MIEIRNLTKKYRELTVIDNFCHSFDGGKVYGIMGENGAGKSTLSSRTTVQSSSTRTSRLVT